MASQHEPQEPREESSDDEETRQLMAAFAPARSVSTAGQAKSKRIIDSNVRNLKVAKHVKKNLSFVQGAPGTRRQKAAVENTLTAFLKARGGEEYEQCPTASILLDYLVALIIETKAQDKDKKAPSLSTIRSQWFIALQYCTTRWEEFEKTVASKNLQARAKAILAQQVQAGTLIKGIWRDRHWVGVTLMHFIVTKNLEHALRAGVQSWDFVVMDILAIVLTSATGARGGDIAVSDGYSNDFCLKYRDIRIQLEGGKDLHNLCSDISLEHQKGSKDTANQRRVISLKFLEGDNVAVICPIRWLLIHGLRHGLFLEDTLDEILARAASRDDGLIEWRRPDLPVCCQRDNVLSLNLMAPLSGRLLCTRFQSMGQIAGIDAHLVLHDTRRGRAKDGSKSKSALPSREAARVSINHAIATANNGLTNHYMGDADAFLYNDAVATMPVHRSAPRQVHNYAPVTQKRSSPQDITDYANEHGLDPSNVSHRQRAGNMLRKSREHDAVHGPKNTGGRRVLPPKSSHQPPMPDLDMLRVKVGEHASRSSTNSMSAASQPSPQLSQIAEHDRDQHAASMLLSTTHNSLSQSQPAAQAPLSATSIDQPSLSSILDEEAVASDNNDLPSKLTRIVLSAESTTEPEFVDRAVEHLNTLDAGPVLMARDFIERYARINVSIALAYNLAPSGNSRDPPSPPILRCDQTGCNFTTIHQSWYDMHKSACENMLPAQRQSLFLNMPPSIPPQPSLPTQNTSFKPQETSNTPSSQFAQDMEFDERMKEPQARPQSQDMSYSSFQWTNFGRPDYVPSNVSEKASYASSLNAARKKAAKAQVEAASDLADEIAAWHERRGMNANFRAQQEVARAPAAKLAMEMEAKAARLAIERAQKTAAKKQKEPEKKQKEERKKQKEERKKQEEEKKKQEEEMAKLNEQIQLEALGTRYRKLLPKPTIANPNSPEASIPPASTLEADHQQTLHDQAAKIAALHKTKGVEVDAQTQEKSVETTVTKLAREKTIADPKSPKVLMPLGSTLGAVPRHVLHTSQNIANVSQERALSPHQPLLMPQLPTLSQSQWQQYSKPAQDRMEMAVPVQSALPSPALHAAKDHVAAFAGAAVPTTLHIDPQLLDHAALQLTPSPPVPVMRNKRKAELDPDEVRASKNSASNAKSLHFR